MDNHNEKKTKQIKRILAIITIVFVILIGYFIGRPLVHFVSDPKQFRVWVNDKGIWGVLGFIGMNILQVLLAVIPGGPFEIGAGYAFGVIRGTLICDFAMTTASVIIFLFVRRFGMKFVELFVSREKIESVKILKSSRRSESIIFLLFLIPGTPKDLLSYLVGLTDIKLSHWIIICAVGRMPAIFLSVLSGNALNKADYTFVILMFAVMIALSICGFLFYRSRSTADSLLFSTTAAFVQNFINADVTHISIFVFHTDHMCGYPLIVISPSLLIQLDADFFPSLPQHL